MSDIFFYFLSLLFGAAACRGRGNRWGRWIVNNTFKTKARGSANLMTSTGENYVAGTTFRFCFCFSVGVGRWWQSAVRARSNVSAIQSLVPVTGNVSRWSSTDSSDPELQAGSTRVAGPPPPVTAEPGRRETSSPLTQLRLRRFVCLFVCLRGNSLKAVNIQT